MDSYVQEDDDNDVYDKEDDDDHSRVFLGAKAPHRCRMPGEPDNSAYHDYAQVFFFLPFQKYLALCLCCCCS